MTLEQRLAEIEMTVPHCDYSRADVEFLVAALRRAMFYFEDYLRGDENVSAHDVLADLERLAKGKSK